MWKNAISKRFLQPRCSLLVSFTNSSSASDNSLVLAIYCLYDSRSSSDSRIHWFQRFQWYSTRNGSQWNRHESVGNSLFLGICIRKFLGLPCNENTFQLPNGNINHDLIMAMIGVTCCITITACVAGFGIYRMQREIKQAPKSVKIQYHKKLLTLLLLQVFIHFWLLLGILGELPLPDKCFTYSLGYILLIVWVFVTVCRRLFGISFIHRTDCGSNSCDYLHQGLSDESLQNIWSHEITSNIASPF